MRYRSREEYIKHIQDAVAAEAQRQTKEILTKSITDFLPIVKLRIREIFNKAVTEFYNDYTPRRYDRRGDTSSKTGGLYDLLVVKIDGSGLKLSGEFDESAILFRNARLASGVGAENGLYDQVFRHGWHGGSPRGLLHPNPSDTNDGATPYWRYPHPSYRRWSDHPADVALESPLARFKELLNEYETGDAAEDYRRCYARHYHPIDLSRLHF